MNQKNKIKPGDLVIWANEAQSGDILEVGVVASIEEKLVSRDKPNPMQGAKIIWETGIYWSPLDQIVSVKEYEKNSKTG